MSTGIYGYWPNGKFMEILNYDPEDMAYRTVIARELGPDEAAEVHAMRAAGLSDEEIQVLRTGEVAPAAPEPETDGRVYEVAFDRLDAEHLVRIIERCLDVPFGSGVAADREELAGVAGRLMEREGLRIVLMENVAAVR
ncbi:MAG: hypothetical protein ACOCVS_01685 [Planctomycetota bacterium]